MLNTIKTKEEIIKDTIIEIDTLIESGRVNLKSANEQAYDLFYNNPEVTTQEICDVLGEESKKLLDYFASNKSFFTDTFDEELPLAEPQDMDIIKNDDGTVIISQREIKVDIVEKEPTQIEKNLV